MGSERVQALTRSVFAFRYLTRIAMGGKVIAAKWAEGLNAPKGIRSVGMTIWVADIDEVVGFELTASGARLASRVKVGGADVGDRKAPTS